RIPILPAAPDPLAGSLRLCPQLGEVDAGDAATLHAHDAIDDDGFDVVADAAIDQALDRIAHRAEAQRVAAGEADDNDVGLGPGRRGGRCRRARPGARRRASRPRTLARRWRP